MVTKMHLRNQVHFLLETGDKARNIWYSIFIQVRRYGYELFGAENHRRRYR